MPRKKKTEAEKEYERVKKSSKPGEGKRFKALKNAIKSKNKSVDADAIAAAIGRKKYGKKKFAKMGAKGKK